MQPACTMAFSRRCGACRCQRRLAPHTRLLGPSADSWRRDNLSDDTGGYRNGRAIPFEKISTGFPKKFKTGWSRAPGLAPRLLLSPSEALPLKFCFSERASALKPNLRKDDNNGCFRRLQTSPPAYRPATTSTTPSRPAADAAQLTPNLRDDPDAGGQGIRGNAAHGPTPSLRDDPDAGGQIRSAVQPAGAPASGTTLTPAARSHSAVRRLAGPERSATTLTPAARSKVGAAVCGRRAPARRDPSARARQ